MSFVFLSGLACLEAPRIPDPKHPKTFIFNVRMHSVDQKPSDSELLLHLSYFNKGNIVFEGSLDCFIHAKVAEMSSNVEFSPDPKGELSRSDYHLSGEIIRLTPILAGTEGVIELDGPAFHICGKVSEIKGPSFGIDATQYTQLDHSGSLHVSATIPKTARFKEPEKFVPRKNSSASIFGEFIGFENQEDRRVIALKVEEVSFLGQAPIHLSSPTPTTPSPDRKRKADGEFESSPLADKRRRLLGQTSSSSSISSMEGSDKGKERAL